MIKYHLRCSNQHQFESWFKDSAAYEALEQARQLACPECGDGAIRRAIMAPAVRGTRRDSEADKDIHAEAEVPPPNATPQHSAMPMPGDTRFKAMLRALHRHVEANFDNVGQAFAEEARKIHHGEAEERGIYGEASAADAEALWEDGIPILPLPKPPEDA